MQKKNSFWRRINGVMGSGRFFGATVVILVLEAAWIALSGRYPMAFDENFHLGIIRLYASHLSPFWSGQPAGADAFGAAAQDPSYLYQYLMSFPYRLITVFTHDQTLEVLVMRGLNIMLFASGLPLYRRLLLKTGASRSMVHVCLAIFVLVPIVPLLAAQINYDNLLLPLTAVTLLVTLRCSDELRRYKRINTKLLLSLLIICLLGSLVKYAFLPIFLAVVVYLVVSLKQTYHGWHKFWLSLGFGFTLITRWLQVLLVVSAVLAAVLFGQRYGINLVRYHEPIPDCSVVLSVAQCSAYGPWARDYNLAQAKAYTETTRSPITFSGDWVYGMWLRTFFAVDGPGTGFQTRGPLPVPALSAIAFAAVATLAALAYCRRIWRQYNSSVLWLFIIVTVCYVGALWLDEYREFLHTGQAVAINGRYLLPVLLPLLVIGALGLKELLKRWPLAKPTIAGLAILSLLWGGGALTYILRSSDAWYWPSPVVRDANHAVQRVLGPVTPGYHDPVEFL